MVKLLWKTCLIILKEKCELFHLSNLIFIFHPLIEVINQIVCLFQCIQFLVTQHFLIKMVFKKEFHYYFEYLLFMLSCDYY